MLLSLLPLSFPELSSNPSQLLPMYLPLVSLNPLPRGILFSRETQLPKALPINTTVN